MKLNDLKRNKKQILVGRVVLRMRDGFDNPKDIAKEIDEPIDLVTEAFDLITETQHKKSGK